MTQETDRPMAAVARSFQSINLDSKSEQEYQETFKRLTSSLETRVRRHAWRKMNDIRIRYDPSSGLEQPILLALRGNLQSLSLALNGSDLQSSHAKSWYDQIFNHLREMDDLLEQLDISIISRWRGYTPNQGYPIYVDHVSFRVEKISGHVGDLLVCELRQLFEACQSFFDPLDNPPSPSTEFPSATIPRNLVYQLTAASIRKIDAVIESIQKPLLGLAKEEWHDVVNQINSSFTWSGKQVVYQFQSSCPHRTTEYHRRTAKFFQAATPIIKLCRTYFNRLLRSANIQSLIFITSSMEMGEDRLTELIKHAKQTGNQIHALVKGIYRLRDPSLRHEIFALRSSFGDLISPILENYWDSLSATQDPRVDRQAIAGARQWLETWNSLFSLATQNCIDVMARDDMQLSRDVHRH
ncbi:hypothetical protein PtB15_2B809 [Puccinia triticina]|nr:hypothetical protein PtB15_2B809 [Puccinia triticina]